MRITILTYLEREGTKQHDVVVDQVARALREQGHRTSVLGVHGNLSKLIGGIRRRRPELVFNLLEMFGSNVRGDVAVAGLLELLGVGYTGGGPGELFLRQDKGLAKRALAFEEIKYPDFAVFSKDELETGGNLRMPLFVKPLRTDASIGISAGKSLVNDATTLMKRVAEIHKKLGDAAIAEEYIEGREFYVGILGNRDAIAFPPIEVDFSGLPDGSPRVMDQKAKFAVGSAEFEGTECVLADLADDLKAKLQQVSLEAYRALRTCDYGRVDLRLSPAGEIYVLEVNASCYLERTGEFALGAAAAGIDYPTLINRIVEEAVKRYERSA